MFQYCDLLRCLGSHDVYCLKPVLFKKIWHTKFAKTAPLLISWGNFWKFCVLNGMSRFSQVKQTLVSIRNLFTNIKSFELAPILVVIHKPCGRNFRHFWFLYPLVGRHSFLANPPTYRKPCEVLEDLLPQIFDFRFFRNFLCNLCHMWLHIYLLQKFVI